MNPQAAQCASEAEELLMKKWGQATLSDSVKIEIELHCANGWPADLIVDEIDRVALRNRLINDIIKRMKRHGIQATKANIESAITSVDAGNEIEQVLAKLKRAIENSRVKDTKKPKF